MTKGTGAGGVDAIQEESRPNESPRQKQLTGAIYILGLYIRGYIYGGYIYGGYIYEAIYTGLEYCTGTTMTIASTQ